MAQQDTNMFDGDFSVMNSGQPGLPPSQKPPQLPQGWRQVGGGGGRPNVWQMPNGGLTQNDPTQFGANASQGGGWQGGGWGGGGGGGGPGDLNSQINDILSRGGNEANRLTQLEEGRGQRMEDLIGNALGEANKPTFTKEGIDLAMSEKSDAAGQDMLGRMGDLRSYLGGAGITGGGLPAGLASAFELKRQGAITDARRSLYLDKVKQDSLDRARNFANIQTYASAVNRPVSMLNMDWLGQEAGIRLGQSGIEAQKEAASQAASAQETSGIIGGIGSIFGGLLGAI